MLTYPAAMRGTPPVGPDGPPSNFAVTDVSDCADGTPIYQVRFTWQNGDAAAQTRIYTTGGQLVATLSAGQTQHTRLASPGVFTYVLRHYRNGILSDPTDPEQVEVEALDCPAPPGPAAPPSNLTAIDVSQCVGISPFYDIHLSWTNGDAEAHTQVWVNGVLDATLSPGQAGWNLGPLGGHGTYDISVIHVRNNQSSAPASTSVNVAEQDCSPPPGPSGAPTSLIADGFADCHPGNTTPDYWASFTVGLGDPTAQTIVQVTGQELLSTTLAPGVSSGEIHGLDPDTLYSLTAFHRKDSIDSSSVESNTFSMSAILCQG